jgi:hypothetical protein
MEIGGKTGKKLNRKIKCSLKNFRMRMKSSKVA